MGVVTIKTGVACKWTGAWLLVTSGLLLYGETAPSVLFPDFRPTVAVLLLGSVVYAMGCICCGRAGGRALRQPTRKS